MNSKTIAKTFRIPEMLAKKIEKESKILEVSQGTYLKMIFLENQEHKKKREFADSLARLTLDNAYQKEQQELADADFS